MITYGGFPQLLETIIDGIVFVSEPGVQQVLVAQVVEFANTDPETHLRFFRPSKRMNLRYS
jgi:hypothetical protein